MSVNSTRSTSRLAPLRAAPTPRRRPVVRFSSYYSLRGTTLPMTLRAFLGQLQDRIARLLGLDPARRPEIVRTMLHRPSGDAAGYWLQLLIAAALATLGLAL